MQTALVIIIVATAAVMLGRRFFRSLKKTGASARGCACGGCGAAEKQNRRAIAPDSLDDPPGR